MASSISQTFCPNLVPKHAMRRRAAADIAHADEEN